VPAAFTPATRWWEDGSLKWVHIDLQRSLPANGTEELRLRTREGAGPVAESPLRVEEAADHFTVTTGPLRFRVKRRGFDLFEQVWLDGQVCLADRPRGAHIGEGSRTAWAAADADCTVTIEEANALRVCCGQRAGTACRTARPSRTSSPASPRTRGSLTCASRTRS